MIEILWWNVGHGQYDQQNLIKNLDEQTSSFDLISLSQCNINDSF